MPRVSILAAMAAAALSLCAPARSGPVSLDFNFINAKPAGGSLGSTSYTFSANPAVNPAYTIGVDAANTSNAPGTLGTPNLYIKTSGGDESGLGLTNDPTGNHEITPYSIVTVHFAHLETLLNLTKIEFTLGSAQKNEGFKIIGTGPGHSTPTTLFSLVPSSDTPGQYSYDLTPLQIATYTDIGVTALGNSTPVNVINGVSYPNILFNTLTVAGTPVPELGAASASGALAVVGMGVMLFKARRRRVAA